MIPRLSWFLPPACPPEIHTFSPFSADTPGFFVAGPIGSGTTSFLTRFAYTAASLGKRVLILAEKEKFEDSDFAPPENKDDPFLDNISIKYVSGYKDVLRWTNCSQTLLRPYHVIMVDGLTQLMSSCHESNRMQSEYTRMLAYLKEGAACMSKLLRAEGESCIVVCSDWADPSGTARFEWIATRWLPVVLRCRSLPGTFGDTPGPPSSNLYGLSVQTADPALRGPPADLQVEYVTAPGEMRIVGTRQIDPAALLVAGGGAIAHHHD